MNERDIRSQIEEWKLHPEVLATYDKMLGHLKENEVPLATTELTCGPLLQVDSDSETLVGNDKANALLTRNYRKPFVLPNERDV